MHSIKYTAFLTLNSNPTGTYASLKLYSDSAEDLELPHIVYNKLLADTGKKMCEFHSHPITISTNFLLFNHCFILVVNNTDIYRRGDFFSMLALSDYDRC